MSAVEQIETQAAAIQKTPHRISLAELETNIAHEFSIVGGVAARAALKLGDPRPSNETLAALDTFVIHTIVLRNGFTVVGTSAASDPANFNFHFAKQRARENAILQIWPLMGYALRQQRYEAQCVSNQFDRD